MHRIFTRILRADGRDFTKKSLPLVWCSYNQFLFSEATVWENESGSGVWARTHASVCSTSPSPRWRCGMSSSVAALPPWAPSVTLCLVFQEIKAQTGSDSVIWSVTRQGGTELDTLRSLWAESQNPLTQPSSWSLWGRTEGQPTHVPLTDLLSVGVGWGGGCVWQF